MKKLLFALALVCCQNAWAQFFTEAGISPITSRMRTGIALSPGIRFDDFELSLPVTYETGHNLSGGLSAGYRFPGSHRVSEPEAGWVLHAGIARSWHTETALKSGEGIKDGYLPLIGLKWLNESLIGKSISTELRYQGNSFFFLFSIRL